MLKLIRRGFILFLTIFILTTLTSTTVFGDKLSGKLKKQKKQLALSKASIDEINNKMDNIESSIEQLDSDIEGKMQLIDTTNSKIVLAFSDIKLSENAIKNTSKIIDSEQILYNKRLRAMYMNGGTGYLELLLNSKSFVDFLERYQLMKSIIKFDTNLILSLKNKRKTKEHQRAVLFEKKNTLIKYQNNYKTQLAVLNSTKVKQRELITYLQNQEKKYKQAIEAQNAQINATLKQIAAMKLRLKKLPKGTYSSDRLIVYAAKFLGTPYIWGGTTPRGFDCSGFTKYVYAHFGINLNRVSRDQAQQGTNVTKENLRPGDLVFFGNPIHHEGIYVGNNSFIHSPRTGDVIKISSLSRNDFRFGRRVR